MGYSYVFNPLAGAFDTVQNLQTVRAPDNAYIPPTGPTVFSDAFTEASTTLLNLHTPNVGTNWSLALSTGGATYSVFNNGTVRPTTTLSNVGCLYLANNVAPAAAVDVSITAPVVVSGANVVGLVFRYVNSNNYYLLTLSGTRANCILYKKVAGVYTNLGTTSLGMVAGVVWRVRAVGSNIVVYANDIIVKITSDSGITAAGLCGLSAGTIGQNATDDVSNAWQLDNFSVVNYASSGGLVTNGINVTGDIQVSGQIVAHGNNSAIYPAITFAGYTNIGLFVPAADNLALVTGGITRGTFNSWGLYVTGVISPSSGSPTAPSYNFGADTDTGIYNPAANQLGVSVGGALQWTFDSLGRFFTPDALTPGGAYDILTSDQISNSGGNVGGFVVFNSSDYIYTRFKAPSFSNGGGIIGDGKLFFTSGEDSGASVNSGIDFNILATDYGSQIGDFTVQIDVVDGTPGGSINFTAGNSSSGGSGGSFNLTAGSSSDSNGGSVFISGGETELADAGGEVIIAGGFDGDAAYGQVQLQTSPSGPIAVFGAGGSIQATTSVGSSTFVANSGTTVHSASTFDGYTIAQVVKALRNYGWLN